MNSDIQRERKSATFDVEEFASWWYGGADKLRDRREIEADILSDPALKEELSETNLSYQETYDEAIRKCTASARAMQKIQDKRNPGGEEIFPELVSSLFAIAILPQGTPLLLHYPMFLWTIKEQGTPDQVKKWVPPARQCNIIGTYAQTELGHGTFLRGLQTRADYDPATEEFIIHSPTITAYKWWPGGLGHTANYALILAQLYIGDQHCGLQLFIVQLRDEETHMPLPGIIIGEIGNKMGFKTVNNGFVGFNKVRIPRLNMLMRNAQVLPDGTFNKSPASVLTYFTMVYMRAVIVSHSYIALARSTTIAVRYSAVRRESDIDSSEPDKQIIDLLPQQMKLFPQIAKIVAFKLTADQIMGVFNAVQQDFLKGEFERLPEIHALLCCLKAISTQDATSGAETLQQACGAHGNMPSSSLPRFHAFPTASITYEGENTVMYLQTGRYLMKAWALALAGGNLVPTVAYMEQATKSEPFSKWDGSWKCLVEALQFVAANKVRLAYEHLVGRKQKMSSQESFNATSIEIAAASQVHGRAFLAATFLEQLTSKAAEKSEQLNAVLFDLLELYLVNECLEHLADILRYISLSEDEVEQLQFRLETALAAIRPNAVAIVDGFDLHDLVLRSTLGCYDGNMYERIQDAADKCPMKKRVKEQSVRGYLKPIVKSNM